MMGLDQAVYLVLEGVHGVDLGRLYRYVASLRLQPITTSKHHVLEVFQINLGSWLCDAGWVVDEHGSRFNARDVE
jgi:hypothetical protein